MEQISLSMRVISVTNPMVGYHYHFQPGLKLQCRPSNTSGLRPVPNHHHHHHHQRISSWHKS